MNRTSTLGVALKVRDIMHPGVLSVRDDMPLRELAALLIHHKISGAPVVDAEGRPVGVVALSDLVAHAAGLDAPKEGGFLTDLWATPSHDHELHLSEEAVTRDIMTTFVVRVQEEAELTELIDLVCEVRLHRVLVTNGERLTGIVSTIDLVAQLGKLLKTGER